MSVRDERRSQASMKSYICGQGIYDPCLDLYYDNNIIISLMSVILKPLQMQLFIMEYFMQST